MHICAVKPAYVIDLGDHFDMPSLSSFDKGKKSHENKTYQEDIDCGNAALDLFFDTLDKNWRGHKKKCTKIFLMGNHEVRIRRAWELGDATLRETMRRLKPDFSRFDRVIPFLRPIKAGGVMFAHYAPNDNSGKAIGRAHMILNKRHRSFVVGHQQGFDYHEQLTGDGKIIHGIIAGSCYLHEEAYKGPCNHHFRGTIILRNARDGMFDLEKWSLTRIIENFK